MAWFSVMVRMQKAAKGKLMLMMRRAGQPMVSICSEALNMPSSRSGRSRKMTIPSVRMISA